jgi:arginine decarboxylase
LPIHHLDQEPTERATLADLTCDSDGKFDRFIDRLDVKPNLELHPYEPGQPYYLGMFLVGAYQEIMGNLHNMFGDTNTVHVQLTPQGSYAIEHVVKGDTMNEVLSYVQYNGDDLLESLRQASEAALRDGRIEIEEAQRLLATYEEGLRSYTYLNL